MLFLQGQEFLGHSTCLFQSMIMLSVPAVAENSLMSLLSINVILKVDFTSLNQQVLLFWADTD